MKKYSRIGLWDVEQFICQKYLHASIRSIFDVGCAAGRVAILLAEKGFLVSGMDLSKEMIIQAKKNAISRNLSKALKFFVGDMTQLPLCHKSFDCLVIMYVSIGMVIGFEKRNKAFREFHRVLKTNGILIFCVHSFLYPGVLGKNWINWIRIEIEKRIKKKNLAPFGRTFSQNTT